MEVAAALGERAVPSVVDVMAHDPGWLNGYASTVGDAFAMPVWEIDQLGYWASFTCDPITPLDDLDDAVDAVLAVAADSGTPIAAVDDTGSGAEPDQIPAVEPDGARVTGWEGGGLRPPSWPRRWLAAARSLSGDDDANRGRVSQPDRRSPPPRSTSPGRSGPARRPWW